MARVSSAAALLLPDEAIALAASSRAGEESLSASIAPEGLTGPSVSLRWDDGRLGGQLRGVPVSPRWDGAALAGMLGGQPLEAQVWQIRQGFEIEGTFAGRPANLFVSPTVITGTIGRCAYSLIAAGEAYDGWRRCGDQTIPVSTRLALPASLALEADVVQAAVLAALLSDVGRPMSPTVVPERYGLSFQDAGSQRGALGTRRGAALPGGRSAQLPEEMKKARCRWPGAKPGVTGS